MPLEQLEHAARMLQRRSRGAAVMSAEGWPPRFLPHSPCALLAVSSLAAPPLSMPS